MADKLLRHADRYLTAAMENVYLHYLQLDGSTRGNQLARQFMPGPLYQAYARPHANMFPWLLTAAFRYGTLAKRYDEGWSHQGAPGKFKKYYSWLSITCRQYSAYHPRRDLSLLPEGWFRSPTAPIQLTVPMSPALMIPLLITAGLAGFWFFYKSVDFFDHI